MKPIVDSVREKEGGPAAEKKSAQMLLFTFMIAAGALTGEAFYGVEAAILAVLDESALGSNSWWPYARITGFVLINVIFGVVIYILFRKAGIIGSGGTGPNKTPNVENQDWWAEKNAEGASQTVLDAELAD